MSLMTFTSVPVKPETLRRLKAYKIGGRSYDEVVNALMDAVPPEKMWAAYEKQMRTEDLEKAGQ